MDFSFSLWDYRQFSQCVELCDILIVAELLDLFLLRLLIRHLVNCTLTVT